MPLSKNTLLTSLPTEWPDDLLPRIQNMVKATGVKIVVLDDDPTGNQTVHDVAVLTEWSSDALTTAFEDPDAVVYILTNSRSIPSDTAQVMMHEIALNLKAAREITGRDFTIISRSDSTLRGHYPDEVDALSEALNEVPDGVLIVPFFLEGGRFTANDVHYVAQGDTLIPAAETEYARDATFGYQHSNLREWVSEKHNGDILPDDVISITLDDVRVGGPDVVADKLMQSADAQVCIVNAVSYRDVEVFVAGLLKAETQGKRFVYHTAASFVRVRGGIAPIPLLKSEDLCEDVPSGDKGGVIIVGSYVNKTTLQMEAARALPNLTCVEVSVAALLDDALHDIEIARAITSIGLAARRGYDSMVYTSRDLITQAAGFTPLKIGQRVSEALIAIVQGLETRPAWMIAKGGITSSDVATQGLGVKRAWVLGQAIPGIPVWRTGPESRWPDMIYVVFPGNVGDMDALAEMIRILRG